MMGGIIESKLFFRIHFSQLNFEWEVNTTIKVLYSQSTFANLIWIEYFCIMKWKFYLLFGEDYLLWMCTYILRWNQSSNAKQICTHRSYLKYASKFESEVWKEFKCVLTLLCIQTKRGEKKCILVLPKLTNMIFFVKEDLGIILLWRGKCSYISVTQEPNPF